MPASPCYQMTDLSVRTVGSVNHTKDKGRSYCARSSGQPQPQRLSTRHNITTHYHLYDLSHRCSASNYSMSGNHGAFLRFTCEPSRGCKEVKPVNTDPMATPAVQAPRGKKVRWDMLEPTNK